MELGATVRVKCLNMSCGATKLKHVLQDVVTTRDGTNPSKIAKSQITAYLNRDCRVILTMSRLHVLKLGTTLSFTLSQTSKIMTAEDLIKKFNDVTPTGTSVMIKKDDHHIWTKTAGPAWMHGSAQDGQNEGEPYIMLEYSMHPCKLSDLFSTICLCGREKETTQITCDTCATARCNRPHNYLRYVQPR